MPFPWLIRAVEYASATSVMLSRPTVFSVRPSTSPVFGCLSSSPSRYTMSSTPATTPSRFPTERVTRSPSTLITSPSTFGKRATTWATRVVIGVGAGPAPPLGGDCAQAGGAPKRTRRSNKLGQRIIALIIPTPKEQGKQCDRETTGPRGSLPPGPRTSHLTLRLEAEANASRRDSDRLHPDVLADRSLDVVVGADEPVSQGVVGHHVAGRPVKDQAGSEPVGEGQVELGSEELGVTLGLAALPRLAADEGRLQTAIGHEVGVGVHLVHRPARRDTGAHGEGRRPRIAGLDTGDDTTVLVPADFRAGVTRGARGTHDLVVVDTQGDDLGAPVRQVACVSIQRLEVSDVLVWVALRGHTRSRHDQMGQEERSELIAGPHVNQPRTDTGGLPGAG